MTKYDFHLPPKGVDDRDSSLIVYTVTIAISIALLVWVITPTSSCKNSTSQVELLKVYAAIFLTISTMLLFLSIAIIVDITSFANYKSNSKHSLKAFKYRISLLAYNLAVALIILSILGICLNYLLNTSLFISSWLNGVFIFLAFIVAIRVGQDIVIVLKAKIGPTKEQPTSKKSEIEHAKSEIRPSSSGDTE